MKIIKEYLKKRVQHLPNKCKAPIMNSYCTEVYLSEELDALDAVYFQYLIGILRWIVELGRMDIAAEVSCFLCAYHYQEK